MHIPTIHNPTNFEPRDYTVLDYLDNQRPQYFGQPIPAWEQEIAQWEADMLRIFGEKWRAKIHHCAHCGNGRVRWIAAVQHVSGDVVVFGSECVNRLGFADRVSFKLAQVQARAEARKVRFTIWNKRVEFLKNNPAIAEALTKVTDPIHKQNSFVADVLRKLDQYGELSPRQVAGVVTSLKRDEETAARKAVEALEDKGDAPSGRAQVTGVVLSVKLQETIYGTVQKMLVKLPTNAKVWLSVPSGANVGRGDTITVRATFTVSDTDRSFAFGKRPTLVRVTKAVDNALIAS